MIDFKTHKFLTEAFGSNIFKDFKYKFSEFHPSFRHDGKTITFNVKELDKDGLMIHLKKFFDDAGTKLKRDLGDIAAYKLQDDIIATIKPPRKEGKQYIIDLKFSYT